MKISLLGAPGSGKGTQSKLICEKYNIPHISTGDLFRNAIKNNTPLGVEIKKYMSTLVPDEIVINLVKERIAEGDCFNGFILDGFPRTLAQAKMFDNEVKLDAVVYFDIELNEAKKRILDRLTCTACGEIYSAQTLKTSVCPKCGEHVDIREEDKNVDARLATYNEFTLPLVEYYSNNGLLKTVKTSKFSHLDFENSKNQTFKEIEKLLEG